MLTAMQYNVMRCNFMNCIVIRVFPIFIVAIPVKDMDTSCTKYCLWVISHQQFSPPLFFFAILYSPLFYSIILLSSLTSPLYFALLYSTFNFFTLFYSPSLCFICAQFHLKFPLLYFSLLYFTLLYFTLLYCHLLLYHFLTILCSSLFSSACSAILYSILIVSHSLCSALLIASSLYHTLLHAALSSPLPHLPSYAFLFLSSRRPLIHHLSIILLSSILLFSILFSCTLL